MERLLSAHPAPALRYIAVTAVVVLLSLCGLALPEVGFLGYVWFSLMRPDLMAYAGPNSLSMLLAAATLAGSLRLVKDVAVVASNPFVVLFLLFQVPIGISVYLTPYPGLVWPKYLAFLQMSLMVALTPFVVSTTERVKRLIWVMGASIGYLGFKYGLIGIARGGMQFAYGEGGFHSDNNTMALGIVMGLPFCWYAVALLRRRSAKLGFAAFASLSLAAVLMSHSRGGILSLAATLFVIGLRSRRRIAFALVSAMIVVPSFLLVKDSLTDRMGTLTDISSDNSAMSRLRAAEISLQVIRSTPLVGVGFGADAFREVAWGLNGISGPATESIVAHNNWLQLWADSGLFALLIFSLMLLGSIAWLGRVIRRLRGVEHLRDHRIMAEALQASLIAFVVGSTFLSRTNYDFIYLVLMTTAAFYRVFTSFEIPDAGASEATEPAVPAAAALRPHP